MYLFIFYISFLRTYVRDAKMGIACKPNLLDDIDPMDTEGIYAKYTSTFQMMKITHYREYCKANVTVAEKAVQDAEKVVKEIRAGERGVAKAVVAQMALSLPDVLLTYDQEVLFPTHRPYLL